MLHDLFLPLNNHLPPKHKFCGLKYFFQIFFLKFLLLKQNQLRLQYLVPSGPVVVSIPVFILYSGCPAQIEFSCLKFLISFKDTFVSG